MMDMVYKQYIQYQWICLKDRNKLEAKMKDIFLCDFNTLWTMSSQGFEKLGAGDKLRNVLHLVQIS